MKLLKLFALLAFVTSAVPVLAEGPDGSISWGVSQRFNGEQVYTIYFTSNGQMATQLQGANLGTDSTPYYTINLRVLKSSVGYVNTEQTFTNVPSTGLTAFASGSFSTATLVSTGATIIAGAITQPTYGRNVVVSSSFTFQTATVTIDGTVVVYGTDTKGNFVTDTINFTTTTTEGSVAFVYISSFAITFDSIGTQTFSNLTISFGDGVKLGLINKITNQYDVYSVIESATNITSGTVNVANDTYLPQAVPDGTNDYTIKFRVKESPGP